MPQLRTLPRIAAAAAAVLGIVCAASQDPASFQQKPFKSAIELVPIDVSVVDRNGKPIENLTAADFALLIDGKPRRIVSAEFVKAAPTPVTRPAWSPYFSSNAHAANGRLVLLVVDQGNISAGRVRAAADSASRFIKRLSPSDRIGLFAIPGPGPQINFTANHALVQAQLPRIVGQAGAALGPRRLGLAESLRVDRGDQTALSAVADRECTGGDRLVCMQEVAAEARDIVGDAQARTRSSVASLRAVLEGLAQNDAPKTVVFLSEALVVDEDRSDLAWVGPLTAKGRVALHVLRIDPPASDASVRRSFNRSEDVAVAEEGLALLAGLARGSLFRVVANADNIFERLTLEMSGYYLLGFEPEPNDRDTKRHKIKIEVPGKRGLEVRARQDFSIETPRAQTAEQAVAEALRSPLLSADIGLKVTAYTFREAAKDNLRVIVAADIDRTANPGGEIALGYALIGPRGNVVSSQFQPQLKAAVRENVQHFVTAAAAEGPGTYGLKLAVVDDKGKRGSVEHSFRAQLTPAGPVQIADLLIGDNSGVGESGAAPTVAGELTDADALHGYMELYSESPDALKDATVVLEIAERADSRALESAAARFDEALSSTSRRVAEGTLPIALLPPGDYHARAVVNVNGRKTAQVVRPFRVLRSAATASTVPSRERVRPTGTAPFASRIDPFQRSAVLSPQVVGFFVDRMGTGNREAVPPDAIEHARAGRFDDAVAAAKRSGHALATAFLEGMTLYARGDLESAAVKFREALRVDSEFFAAAFYLGACYAAGGRDREASAAWQTSLVTEGDAPFIYTLLGDALLRQRDVDGAVEILKEASARWPDDPQVQVRLASALAMAGRAADALTVLDPYLAAHPDDRERLFLALRVIYEAHAAGRTVGTVAEDRSRFERYAAAYAAAGGPQLALVEQWKKFMTR